MRKILILLCLVLSLVYAKTQKLSNIPPASIEYIDVESENCDALCLKNLISKGMNFSFLARFKKENSDKLLLDLYAKLGGFAGKLLVPKNEDLSLSKIAVLIPENVIKGYSKIVTDTIFAYIISEQIEADIRVYLSGNESPMALNKALSDIQNDGIALVVAPLTPNGAKYIAENSDINTFFFIPTLESRAIGGINKGNIFFGGINYEEQIKNLLKIVNSNIILYHDGSFLANTLTGYVEFNTDKVTEKYRIDNSKRPLFNTIDERFNDSAIFLNLPLDKSEFVINEINKNNVRPISFLTTQINYAPKLLNTTNSKINLYVANAITKIPNKIVAISNLLDLDMGYNWVAYSTAIGMDYLYSTFLNTNHTRVFSENIVGAKIAYETKIYKANSYDFELFE